MNNNQYYKNIYINYAFTFLKNLNLTQGIWMLYLASKGLSLFEIGTLEGVFHVTSLIMETPTGAVADIFGRKASRLVGVILAIISSMLMIISDCYLMFALSFVIMALSYNFESGANEALVYDSLMMDKKESLYMKIAGRTEVIYQTTSIVALVLGGIVGNIQYTYVYYIAILLNALALLAGLLFKEPCHQKDKHKTKLLTAMKKQYVESFIAVRYNHRLFYLILFSALLSASVTLSFYYLQIAWQQNGLTTFTIGVYLSVSAAAAAVGAVFADRIEKRLGETVILRTAPFMIAISIIGMYFIRMALLPFCIMSVVETIVFVATRDYINQTISSQQRATILSFESVMFSLVMILIFPLFGLLSDLIEIRYTFILLGGLMFVMSIVNLIVNTKNGK